MKRLLFLLFLAALLGGSYYLWNRSDSISLPIGESTFRTLEMRYTAERLMEAHKKELLKDNYHAFGEPELLFVPHLLMDVKYTTEQGATSDGLLLYSLSDGEMVLCTDTWTKSHGLADCLDAKVNAEEFELLLALNKAPLAQDQLSGNKALEGCLKKKLAVLHDNMVRLHVKAPLFAKAPVTDFQEGIVSLSISQPEKVPEHYSTSLVKNFITKVFGADVAIRSCEKVYLPIHELTVQNPDGSLYKTYWNALTGAPVDERSLR